ncbi:BamA/OMP85 family outer membrane protein [Limnochorda pilosa]|uniref:POTRA domain-containing protein n=1 Tax=Limnochorda pilosa TaxID=1555112 RepID=A0A0K2SP71_LIMPI|nr:BamA/TamA family outer membrane protein [Limnochorda pilosa]BAS28901.1 hypothetical protein LIP_3072 [Limnochorda pilosa]
MRGERYGTIRFLVILTWLLGLVATTALPMAAQEKGADQPTVQSIAVRGNRQIPAERILDAITATRIGRPINPDDLQKDAQSILDLGTFDSVTFQVPTVPGGVQVVFVVKELPVLKQVVLKGLEGQDSQALLAEAGLETGKVIDLNQVRSALSTIQYQVLQKDGLLVRPNQTPAWDEEGTLTLFFAPVKLHAIRTEGNEKTRDFVILREMRIEPGEPIDLNKVDRGLRDVLQLGFFDQVSRSFEETGDPETLDLVVHVTERKTGTASLGVTWSSAGGLGGYVDVSEANFLGRGQEAGVKVQVGAKSTEYELRFREPYLTASGLSLGVSLFNRNQLEESDGWYHDLGTSVSLGHPVGGYSRLIGTFSLDNRTYDQPDEATDRVDSSNRSFELALATNTTDHPFFPTQGYRNRASVTLGGGLLGGDWDYQIYQETYSRYLKVGRSNQTLAFRIDAGVLEGNARSSEKFQVGGSESLRGYDYTKFTDGTRKLVANLEYRFPIADQVQGVVFVDSGRAWREDETVRLSDMATGYGLGVRLNTPIGILRLDYGMSRTEPGKPYISFGQTF